MLIINFSSSSSLENHSHRLSSVFGGGWRPPVALPPSWLFGIAFDCHYFFQPCDFQIHYNHLRCVYGNKLRSKSIHQLLQTLNHATPPLGFICGPYSMSFSVRMQMFSDTMWCIVKIKNKKKLKEDLLLNFTMPLRLIKATLELNLASAAKFEK